MHRGEKTNGSTEGSILAATKTLIRAADSIYFSQETRQAEDDSRECTVDREYTSSVASCRTQFMSRRRYFLGAGSYSFGSGGFYDST